MKHQTLRTSELRTYCKNPRRGNIDAIAESLQANSQYRPIVVNAGRLTGRTLEVLAGNHTLMAARKIGWQVIEAVIIDVDDEQAARIVLADNRLADIGTYDDSVLAEILGNLDGLEGTGWTEDALDELLVGIEGIGIPTEIDMESDRGNVTPGADKVMMLGYKIPLMPDEASDLEVAISDWLDEVGPEPGFIDQLLGMVRSDE